MPNAVVPPLLLLLAAATGSAAPALLPITLRLEETGERVMVDSFGRQRAFHGTNCVVKGPPWIPSRDGFDQFTSLTAKDFQLMRSAGVNAIRLAHVPAPALPPPDATEGPGWASCGRGSSPCAASTTRPTSTSWRISSRRRAATASTLWPTCTRTF